MRRRNTRKVLRELRRLCDANGIDVTVVPGKGSHRGLIFEGRKSGQKVRIVISGGKEISPGVQRGALRYLGDLAVRVALAQVLRKIFEVVFKDQ